MRIDGGDGFEEMMILMSVEESRQNERRKRKIVILFLKEKELDRDRVRVRVLKEKEYCRRSPHRRIAAKISHLVCLTLSYLPYSTVIN